MKVEQYRTWLSGRGVSPASVRTRVYALGRVEQGLADLGVPHADLDAAYEAGALEQVRDAVRGLIEDAEAGGQKYRLLMPQSTNPTKRLANTLAWVGQYGRFREDLANPPARSDWPDLEALRAVFLRRVHDFTTFAQTEGLYFTHERAYKDGLIRAVGDIIQSAASDEEAGTQIQRVLRPNGGPFLRWQTVDAVIKKHPGLAPEFFSIIGRLARSGAPAPEAITQAVDALQELRDKGVTALTQGEILNTSITVTAFARPAEAAPYKQTLAQDLARRLGRPFEPGAGLGERVQAWLALLTRIFEVMRDVWKWQPRDLFDVQGFAWVALRDDWMHGDAVEDEDVETMSAQPTNLILHGPPGTGKTYATAAEAVRLCDGAAPDDRVALMERYNALVEAGQIRFTTFHQSYSYEDFVEGLRPVAAGEDAASGFRLEPRKGIFREICAVAEQARKGGGAAEGFDLAGRQVFKMSLGRAGAEEEVFEAAIREGYAVLGYGGDVDWSDPLYESRQAVHERWNQIVPGTHGNDGNIAQLWAFRSLMREGDLIVASDGNTRFRAIGVVTGPYRFEPTGVGTYSHRRAVDWVLVPDEPLPAAEIYDRNFTMAAFYQLRDASLKREALARLLQSGDGGSGVPDQFVLIIDEINRANISKVFGELITLLEPDKRLGRPEGLTLTLPYSGDRFGVPENLHVIGTMNTADRSIALLDTALRRRFEFRELMPEPEVLQDAADRSGVNLVKLLTALNDRIEYLFDRDHTIGHAYFIACQTREDVDAVMRHRVIPLLAEYFYEDWEKVARVLGDADGQGRCLERRTLKAPDGSGEERHRWVVKPVFGADAYDGIA